MNSTRLMDINDLEDILSIEAKCFETPWSKNAFETELLTNKSARYMVILSDEKVVGYGGMWIILDEAHITNIAIEPEYEGKGLGTELVNAMIDKAISLKVNSMTLEVRESNYRAQGLYGKLGFKNCGKRPKYYQDTNEDAIIMWAEI